MPEYCIDSLTLLKKEAVSIVRYSAITLFNNVVVMTTEEWHTSNTTGILVCKCTQTKKTQGHGVQFSHWHRSMANVIAKIALCDLDLFFGGKNLNILYRWNGKSEECKYVKESFVNFNICHGMVQLLKLHSVTLTYFLEVKI